MTLNIPLRHINSQTLGFCGVHTMAGVNTTVTDEDSLLDKKAGLGAGNFHIGEKATTLALAAIGGGSGTT